MAGHGARGHRGRRRHHRLRAGPAQLHTEALHKGLVLGLHRRLQNLVVGVDVERLVRVHDGGLHHERHHQVAHELLPLLREQNVLVLFKGLSVARLLAGVLHQGGDGLPRDAGRDDGEEPAPLLAEDFLQRRAKHRGPAAAALFPPLLVPAARGRPLRAVRALAVAAVLRVRVAGGARRRRRPRRAGRRRAAMAGAAGRRGGRVENALDGRLEVRLHRLLGLGTAGQLYGLPDGLRDHLAVGGEELARVLGERAQGRRGVLRRLDDVLHRLCRFREPAPPVGLVRGHARAAGRGRRHRLPARHLRRGSAPARRRHTACPFSHPPLPLKPRGGAKRRSRK
mmetsp:Transcript_10605/g.26562  ORF Transcript_10605/g.26562 Transcript_10605/m.26562 type:complete len:339 (-) Transcript_10605:166-1182(-)